MADFRTSYKHVRIDTSHVHRLLYNVIESKNHFNFSNRVWVEEKLAYSKEKLPLIKNELGDKNDEVQGACFAYLRQLWIEVVASSRWKQESALHAADQSANIFSAYSSNAFLSYYRINLIVLSV